jgi:hypothetical protein
MNNRPASYEDRQPSMISMVIPACERDLKPMAWLENLARDDHRDIHFVPATDDIMVQFPRCRTLETLQFGGTTLTPCRRFSQKGALVYHDCGSNLLCRLYGYSRSSGGLVNSRSARYSKVK